MWLTIQDNYKYSIRIFVIFLKRLVPVVMVWTHTFYQTRLILSFIVKLDNTSFPQYVLFPQVTRFWGEFTSIVCLLRFMAWDWSNDHIRPVRLIRLVLYSMLHHNRLPSPAKTYNLPSTILHLPNFNLSCQLFSSHQIIRCYPMVETWGWSLVVYFNTDLN